MVDVTDKNLDTVCENIHYSIKDLTPISIRMFFRSYADNKVKEALIKYKLNL